MKDHLENAVVRGFRAALAAVLALALALPVGGLTTLSAFADEPAQNAAEATPGDADGNAAGDADIKIAVLSDTHYYPLNYVSDCEDYETYVGGDPKMLEESGSILDAALQMVREDAPDILVVSGDLTKDGEKLGHEQLAERFQAIEDETDTEVFVINGNHDVFNYEDSCTFENGSKEYAETTTADDFRKIYANFGYNGDCEAEYFTNPNHDAGEIAGELSYTVDLGKFTIVAVDSGRYSPDADTGYSENEHITAGRVDDDLLPWVVEKIQAADAEGEVYCDRTRANRFDIHFCRVAQPHQRAFAELFIDHAEGGFKRFVVLCDLLCGNFLFCHGLYYRRIYFLIRVFLYSGGVRVSTKLFFR